MSKPHGGRLVDRLVPGEDRTRVMEEAGELAAVEVSDELRLDFENIAFGIFSPLTGPVTANDYQSILDRGRLENDVPWTIPIVLDVPGEAASGIREGDAVALSNHGALFATLTVEDIYSMNRTDHSLKVYKTLDEAHPGVAKIMEMNPVLLGGPVSLFKETPGRYPRYRLMPRETRFLFRERGWRTVAGFQTRNAPHIGHEYVQKTALSFVDGLFINPLIGRKKRGDFRDEVILESYEALMDHYYLANAAVLVVLEMEMRYAGPREAIFHSIVRKNYGCTHFIVGRDHAGVGNFYGPFDAQGIFDDYPDLGITPIFFRSFFHCNRCGGPQNDKVCPHGPEDRINFSGTKMRALLSRGERPSPTMMRPEVVDAILRHKQPFVE